MAKTTVQTHKVSEQVPQKKKKKNPIAHISKNQSRSGLFMQTNLFL